MTQTTRFNLSILAPTALLIAVAITCTGCGASAKKTAHLAGTITVAGQAPPEGTRVRLNISPTTAEQGPGAGSRVAGNKYDCPNCPLGKVTVYISVDRLPAGATVDAAAISPRELTSLIDPIYSAGLELEVTADNLNQNFDLKPFKP